MFQQPSVVTYSNVSIYKVNAITYTFPEKTDAPAGTDNNFKIAVSHYPVTMRVMFSKKVSIFSFIPNKFYKCVSGFVCLTFTPADCVPTLLSW